MLGPVLVAANSAEPDVAAEANHRIANNLSMIAGLARIQAANIARDPRGMSADEVRDVLAEFGRRLETVARLHRLLANRRPGTAIDLADYLRDIAEAAVSCLSFAGRIRLQLFADSGCLVPPERALALGLIVSEVVTNSIKYAHPAAVAGIIGLTCRRSADGAIAIEISDDGVGLPEGFDPMEDGHLGFRMVRLLAKQHGATVTFDSKDLGLCFMLRMPPASTR